MTSMILAVTLVAAFALPLTTPAQSPTPTDAFLAYRKALASAKAYSDILPFMESKSRAMVEGMPAPQQASMFGFLMKFAATFTDVAVTKETVTGDTAVLELGGKDPKGQSATGSVPMTKEATGWKVGAEKWSSKPRTADR
jgi:hypothetical protein